MFLIPQKVKEEEEIWEIDERYLSISPQMITLRFPKPVKTMSSGVIGAGVRWTEHLVNRHVTETNDCDNYREDMKNFLLQHSFNPAKTVGMMTAVQLEDVSFRKITEGDLSIFVVVTAGVGKAVDVSRNSDLSLIHI